MNLNLYFCFFGGGDVHSFRRMSSLRAGSCHWNQVQIGGGCESHPKCSPQSVDVCVSVCLFGVVVLPVCCCGFFFFGDFFFLVN